MLFVLILCQNFKPAYIISDDVEQKVIILSTMLSKHLYAGDPVGTNFLKLLSSPVQQAAL